jgi:hypothetical protein
MNRRAFRKRREALKRRMTSASRSESEVDRNWLRIYKAMMAGDLKLHRSQQRKRRRNCVG